MKILLTALSLLLAGCATQVDIENTGIESNSLTANMVTVPTTAPQILTPPPCKQDRFSLDAIPVGYVFNPRCPPEIIWPGNFSLWANPGPMRTEAQMKTNNPISLNPSALTNEP